MPLGELNGSCPLDYLNARIPSTRNELDGRMSCSTKCDIVLDESTLEDSLHSYCQ